MSRARARARDHLARAERVCRAGQAQSIRWTGFAARERPAFFRCGPIGSGPSAQIGREIELEVTPCPHTSTVSSSPWWWRVREGPGEPHRRAHSHRPVGNVHEHEHEHVDGSTSTGDGEIVHGRSWTGDRITWTDHGSRGTHHGAPITDQGPRIPRLTDCGSRIRTRMRLPVRVRFRHRAPEEAHLEAIIYSFWSVAQRRLADQNGFACGTPCDRTAQPPTCVRYSRLVT